MAIRMGYWDCPSCKHKRIDGPDAECPTCGQPREDDIEFYTDDDAAVVEDPELIRQARLGADWNCQYCGVDNKAGKVECNTCGAGPDGSKSREQRVIMDAPADSEAALGPAAAASGESGGKGGLLVVLAVLAVIGGLVWFFFMRTTDAKVTVTGSTWTKTLQIEKRTIEKKEAWADQVPSDAKIIKKKKKKRLKRVQDGTKKVKVGKKDLGNGMFEDVYEKRPNMVDKKVKDHWVSYEVIRWIQGKQMRSDAKDGAEPADPEFNPSKKKRVGKRTSVLVVTVKTAEGTSHSSAADVGDECRHVE